MTTETMMRAAVVLCVVRVQYQRNLWASAIEHSFASFHFGRDERSAGQWATAPLLRRSDEESRIPEERGSEDTGAKAASSMQNNPTNNPTRARLQEN